MKWPDHIVEHSTQAFLSDIEIFSRYVLERPLRPYQAEPAQAIFDSIRNGSGLEFAVVMSRQAGKNELTAQLETYLLNIYQRAGGQIVKASPTFKPQTINSMLRLEHHLNNPLNRPYWRKRSGYIFQLVNARVLFFSAEPSANVVGGTASLLLECDEAQDVSELKWHKDFEPMGASTNVTTVFTGTAWTSRTLLSQTIAHLQRQQRRDGIRRVFSYNADIVGQHVPAYRDFVTTRIAKLGRNHPLIRTQYFLEEIDADAGMFPANRQALMRGDHERRHDPIPGHRYAILIDVAGEDETEGRPLDRTLLASPHRDATALTVVDVDYEYGRLPTYRTVDRHLWIGTKHTALYQQILALVRHWHAIWLVVDATGVGAGLSSFLVSALPHLTIIPVTFSNKTKSDLGWNFLAIVETGRYQDYIPDDQADTRQFWYEVDACQREVRSGPNRLLKWGVWDDPAYDGLIAYGHDDLLISAALTAILDNQDWPGSAEGAAVETGDVLEDIDDADW